MLLRAIVRFVIYALLAVCIGLVYGALIVGISQFVGGGL